MASDQVIHLEDSNFEEETKSGYALIDFWAAWCGPCVSLAPLIDEIAGDMEGKLKVCKLDVDKNMESAARFGVRGALHPQAGRGDYPATVQLRGQGRAQGRPSSRDDPLSRTHGDGEGRSTPDSDQVVLDPAVLALRADATRARARALPVERRRLGQQRPRG